jgi:uncharacterized iron-regulated membrane protein
MKENAMTNSLDGREARISAAVAIRPLCQRLHMWAGLVISPLALLAALTGLLYVVSPQLERWLHADLDRVKVAGAALPLDAQVQAALSAEPHAMLRSIVPGREAGATTQVFVETHGHGSSMGHDHGQPMSRVVYVDPYTAQVVGVMDEIQRYKVWARKLHSSFLLGGSARWLLELAASWMVVMFITGVLVWWPKPQAEGGLGWRALLPRWGKGRLTWRDLHSASSIAMSGVLGIVLVTGLTWAEYSGANFARLQRGLGQGSPQFPASLASAEVGPAGPLTLQQVYDKARSVAPDVPMRMTPPKKPNGVWRIESADSSRPLGRFRLALDEHSGDVLFSTGWEELPLLSKATTVGIPFHRGEFGVWNQLLLGAAALSVVFSVVSGWVMWWKRRPAQRTVHALGDAALRSAPWWFWGALALLGLALPVFGVSAIVVLAIEAVRHARARRAAASA